MTPAVFVPSDVWRQNGMIILRDFKQLDLSKGKLTKSIHLTNTHPVGARINDYALKLDVFQDVYDTLEMLHNTPLPSDGTSYKLMYNRGATNESVAKFQNAFSNCCVKLLNIQMTLHRAFSYIPAVDKQLTKGDYGRGSGGSVFKGVKDFMQLHMSVRRIKLS